jgi:hypothetical protein
MASHSTRADLHGATIGARFGGIDGGGARTTETQMFLQAMANNQRAMNIGLTCADAAGGEVLLYWAAGGRGSEAWPCTYRQPEGVRT